MPKSIECHVNPEEDIWKNILYTKNKQNYRILEYTVFWSGVAKVHNKLGINFFHVLKLNETSSSILSKNNNPLCRTISNQTMLHRRTCASLAECPINAVRQLVLTTATFCLFPLVTWKLQQVELNVPFSQPHWVEAMFVIKRVQ